MELQLQIKMNPNLYVRDPEMSELGKSIIREGIKLFFEIGFEEFTFKKLASKIGTTEASIYRYFENKHRLLTYLITWFWTWLEYQLIFHTNNLVDPKEKINIVIDLLTFRAKDQFITDEIDKYMLNKIVISEGVKSFLTKNVTEDNKAMLFQPYKDLCHRIADIFLSYKKDYPFPHSLASSIIEIAHYQTYFKDHLPRLTDFPNAKDSNQLVIFIKQMVFSTLDYFKKST
jgi:AcrR family transcriptional regulator